jgi:hypothetical protein
MIKFLRTSGKSLTVNLGEKTHEETFLVEDKGDEGEGEEGKSEGGLFKQATSTSTEGKKIMNRTVVFTSLDDVLADNGYSSTCPEFIRITDYGGNELSVLKGALTTLACTKVICVSGSVMRSNDKMPFAADVISFLNDKGFAIYNTYENQRIRFFNVQIDMLFVKKEIMDEMYEVGFKAHLT